MATKWKNSKLRTFTKIIAFVLAVLVSGYAGLFAMNALQIAKNDDIAYGSYFSDAFSVESETDVYSSDFLRAKLDGYVAELSYLVGRYGNGSEESYEIIKKNHDARYNLFKAHLCENLAYLVNTQGQFQELLRQMTIDVVSLEKIAEPDFDVMTITEYGYDEVTDYDYTDVWTANYPSNTGVFSSEIKKKAEKVGADVVIRLESLLFSNTLYSGYYALEVNDDIFEYYLCDKYGYLTKVADEYEDFHAEYDIAVKEFDKKYKNINYIVSSSSGYIQTNVKKLSKNWKDNIKQTMEKYDYYLSGVGDSMYEDNFGRTRIYDDAVFFSSYANDYNEFTTMYYDDDYDYGYETTMVGVTTAATYIYQYGNLIETSMPNAIVETTSHYLSEEVLDVGENATTYIFFNDDAVFSDFSVKDIGENYAKTSDFLRWFIQNMANIFIILLVLCILLICLSGNGSGKLTVRDKIFIDIKLLINGAAMFVVGLCLWEMVDLALYRLNTVKEYMIYLAALGCAAAGAIGIDFLMFIARRVKNKTFLNGIFIVWLVRNCKQKISDMYYAKSVSKAVKIKTIALIGINVIVGVSALYWVWDGYDSALVGAAMFVVLFVFDVFVLLRGLRFVGAVEKLFSVIEGYKKGNLDEKININALPRYLVVPAENLQGVGDGLKLAVDEAVRQEKTKTELITNISHDLKTPLTSIINYVELLKDCGITDETALSYLAVLGEKSDKLKNLIVDLVEASKAATGNVSVEFVEVSLKELLNQLLGEFCESFEEKSLVVVDELPEQDILVKADSKLLYRVLENLFVNIGKYALDGTRVYIKLQKNGNKGEIILKNISAAPLNISPDELKQRFVRGDESRSTEGNGLGLSIAENLCLCQNARLDIEIVGDLFIAKVVLESL